MYPLDATTKLSIRSDARALRRQLSREYCSDSSHAICSFLKGLNAVCSGSAIAGYRRCGSEADVDEFLSSIMTCGKSVYLPRVAQNNSLDLCAVNNLEKCCRKGAFGILEPTGPAEDDLAMIDVILVPGVAFDGYGGRIGSGMGYYDRLLRRLGARACRVGITFECGVYGLLPSDPWDERMDWVVSERGVRRCSVE